MDSPRQRRLAIQTTCAAALVTAVVASFIGCKTNQTDYRLTSLQVSDKIAQEKETGILRPELYPSLKPNEDLFKALRPSNDREWSPDMSRTPTAEIHNDWATIHNVRNARYRTIDDYALDYYDKAYDLRRLTSVDFIVSPFNELPGVAHTMLSFGFEDKDYVVISVEIRREKGEKYGPVKGFANQYELMYVAVDERDVITKYANTYNCQVFVYRSTATSKQARDMFEDMLRRMNKLSREPEFYNTLTNNCTTNIRRHINDLKPNYVPYDYRVLLPGYADRLAYDLGLIESKGTFEETRRRAQVNYQAYLYRDDPAFSQKIRR